MYLDACGGAFDVVDVLAEAQVEALRERGRDGGRHVVVFGAHELQAALDHRHLRAERTEHVRQLAGDEPAAEHDEVLGYFIEAHDVVARVVTGLGQAGDVGDRRSCACREHHVAALDARDRTVVAGHLHLTGADEPPTAGVHRDVGAVVSAVALAPGGDGVDAAEHAVADVAPAHLLHAGVDAEVRRMGDGVRHIGGVHEHLRGDAPAVQAGAAEYTFFDDGDAPVVERRPDDRVAAAGADDDEVVLLHARHVTGASSPGVPTRRRST